MASLWVCSRLSKIHTTSSTVGKTAQEDEGVNPLKARLGITCLFCKHWVARELGEVQELQVQGPKFCQDAASSGCPAPAPTHATARREKGALTARRKQPELCPGQLCLCQVHGLTPGVIRAMERTHAGLGHSHIFSSSSSGMELWFSRHCLGLG